MILFLLSCFNYLVITSRQNSVRVRDSFLSVRETIFCLRCGQFSVPAAHHIDAIGLPHALMYSKNQLFLFQGGKGVFNSHLAFMQGLRQLLDREIDEHMTICICPATLYLRILAFPGAFVT
jgi:hypothetical protein